MFPLPIDLVIGCDNICFVGQKAACFVVIFVEERIDLIPETAINWIDNGFFSVVLIDHMKNNLRLFLQKLWWNSPLQNNFLTPGRIYPLRVGSIDMAARQVGDIDRHLPQGKIIFIAACEEP